MKRSPEELQRHVDLAASIGLDYGQTDGAHHKDWVISQMLRALLADDFTDFIERWESKHQSEWDYGTPP